MMSNIRSTQIKFEQLEQQQRIVNTSPRTLNLIDPMVANALTRPGLLVACFLMLFNSYGQGPELVNQVPLSPNAASIVKYGEIPVGHFTGVPNINIPITTIKSGNLSLPLGISYHAGGLKVEDIASSVGMGWSLASIPQISRSVMTLPDEGTGGFFSKYNGMTVSELDALLPANNTKLTWGLGMAEGTVDPEPDIFYYKLNNESGKFFYNQETEQFHLTPKSNSSITFSNGNFEVIDDLGVKYIFDEQETTSTNSSSPITTTWRVSKILSADKTDSILFDYTPDSYSYQHLAPVTKYILCSLTPGGNTLTSQISEQVPNRITYNDGYVQFNYSITGREDLTGSAALSDVQVFDFNDVLLKKATFTQSYWNATTGGTRCNNLPANDPAKKRLLLDEVSFSGNQSVISTYSLDYNKAIAAPCRQSSAQDFWGYYNGKINNTDLVPTTSYQISGQNHVFSGADRSVNLSTGGFGMLKKITYPTGGYSEFTYENNEVTKTNTLLPSQYISKFAYLGDWDLEFIENLPVTHVETSDPFVIQSGPDIVVNGNNPQGGALISISAGGFGCDLSGGTNSCAAIKLVSSGVLFMWITGDVDVHLPNGTYTFEASFDQDPPNYEEFYLDASYKEIDLTSKRYAGGLRVKTIQENDGVSNGPFREYVYTTALDSDDSSGDIFGLEYMNYFDEIEEDQTVCFRLKSYPNMQQITSSGSLVGYEKVFVKRGNTGQYGVTQYEFSLLNDEGPDIFPYPPLESYEYLRGRVKKVISYKNESSLIPVRETIYEYKEINEFNVGEALKFGIFDYAPGPVGGYSEIKWEMYDLNTGWSKKSKETVISHLDGQSVTSVTDYFYDSNDHLNLTRSSTTNSSGEVLETTYRYAEDFTSPSGITNTMITKNMVAIPMEQIQRVDGQVIAASGTEFQHDVAIDAIQMKSTYQYETTVPGSGFSESANGTTFSAYRKQLTIHKYDNHSNVLEFSKEGDVHSCYIWGYNQTYPVAQVVNATFAEIEALTGFGSGFHAGTGGLTPTQESTLRSGLSNAQVTTYSYKPGIGVLTMSDPNGRITTYEYDEFGRLERVRDHEDKILQQHEYNYGN